MHRTCDYCNKALEVSRWDDLNGFVVLCPHCRAYNGRKWSVRGVLWGGLLLNVLSFFLVMRPKNAALCSLPLGALLALGDSLNVTSSSDLVQGLYFGALLLGPVLVNAAVLVRHSVLVGTKAPVALTHSAAPTEDPVRSGPVKPRY
jgi:hypothetical protein